MTHPNTTDTQNESNRPDLASRVLFLIGLVDLLRGTLHTFFVHWADATFAHLNLTVNGQDQLTLLGAFGISNLLTGALYILISRRARHLATVVLILIPVAYAVGLLGLYRSGVHPDAAFLGRYFMLVYFGVCAGTAVFSVLRKNRPLHS